MTDGTEPIAQETPEAGTQPAPENVELQSEPEQLGEGQPQIIEDDSEEIDFDGEKYKVPKKLKDSFLMHGDYTRKTQEVARQREAIEARAAEVTREAEARKGLEKEIGRLTLIDEQLSNIRRWTGLRCGPQTPSRPTPTFRITLCCATSVKTWPRRSSGTLRTVAEIAARDCQAICGNQRSPRTRHQGLESGACRQSAELCPREWREPVRTGRTRHQRAKGEAAA
jgi:hypothetical protein